MNRRNFLALTGAAAVCPIGCRPEGKMITRINAVQGTLVSGHALRIQHGWEDDRFSALSESAGRTQMSIAGRFAEIAAMLTIETGDGSPLIDDDLARELMETPA